MKALIVLLLVGLALPSSAEAEKENLTKQNQTIDQGMKEAGEKAKARPSGKAGAGLKDNPEKMNDPEKMNKGPIIRRGN